MLIRFHHVLADGRAALLLPGTLFDAAPEAPQPQGPPWTARPMPTRAELLGDALGRSIAGIRRGVHLISHRPGLVIIADKGYISKALDSWLEQRGVTIVRPTYRNLSPRPGERLLRPIRQPIESVNDTLRASWTWDARTLTGHFKSAQREVC